MPTKEWELLKYVIRQNWAVEQKPTEWLSERTSNLIRATMIEDGKVLMFMKDAWTIELAMEELSWHKNVSTKAIQSNAKIDDPEHMASLSKIDRTLTLLWEASIWILEAWVKDIVNWDSKWLATLQIIRKPEHIEPKIITQQFSLWEIQCDWNFAVTSIDVIDNLGRKIKFNIEIGYNNRLSCIAINANWRALDVYYLNPDATELQKTYMSVLNISDNKKDIFGSFISLIESGYYDNILKGIFNKV